MSLFRTKSVEVILAESEDTTHHLKRTLGPVNLVALGIGAIIGAGLFSLTGIAAADNAGPAVVLSFVVAAVGCAFAGMCYSEFATMIPIAGSAYTYAYATMGELLAWIIGWDLVLEYAVGAATVSVSWSAYVVRLLERFGIHLPSNLIHCPWDTTPGWINLPAVLVICAISVLLMIGISESARVNAWIVVVKVTIVIIVIAIGFHYIKPENYTPFIPPNTGKFGEFGFSGVMRAAAVIFFAYIGFDAVSTAAQEAKKPKRDMPIGIIGSLIVCTILYVLFAHVLTGMVNYRTFRGDAAPVETVIAAVPLRLAANRHQHRHHRRLQLGDSRDAARPVARVLLDVARRPAAARLLRHSFQVAHALALQPDLSWCSSASSPASRPSRTWAT
jgi:APA family basic amino acid/polyamine antiporter